MSQSAPISAETLRHLFENARVGIMVANDNGTYVEANEAACALLGGTREEIIGASIGDFVDPSRASAVKAQWGFFLKDGHQSGEFEIRRLDGTSRLLRFDATARFARGLHCTFLTEVKSARREEAGERQGK